MPINSEAAGKTVTYLDDDRIEREWTAKIPRPPLSSLIDHIDHIAKVAGIDHVGLGSDFDGVSGATPAGIDSAADLPKITQALLDRGYSADDIRKILGGNLLRVFREAEKSATKCKLVSECGGTGALARPATRRVCRTIKRSQKHLQEHPCAPTVHACPDRRDLCAKRCRRSHRHHPHHAGDLHCTLFPKVAPIGVENFIGLANGTKDWTSPSRTTKSTAFRSMTAPSSIA